MIELERDGIPLVPFEAVLDPETVEILKSGGLKGLVPVELRIGEIRDAAEKRGYRFNGMTSADSLVTTYLVFPRDAQSVYDGLLIYEKQGTVYLTDDELELFKDLLMRS